ncbi:glycosyltransferase family 39 protein [Hymenobacter volaticus]|uniref:Glycosyltransferase family 39 protein n=1 Tax=Hymenobacter volaticus TaxID=2932254 RepID=A0ABY4G5I3_9BACT|nr:glycosyltransferase family 39 protein [Hymenobacter volaticus]UOQ66035.1 glycosyltransferase family 39 protein [Hymenobacter volaticus]
MPFASSLILRFTAADRLYKLLAVLFFVGLSLVFYLPSLNWLPRGIHEWAQADRLALAISFYDNGLRFFRPQTLSLTSIDAVVGVEFPLISYLAALGAKLTGRDSLVIWFRGLNIAFACVSYYYLFRLVFERTQQFVLALVPGVFLATSPVFAYYAGNFLPDSTSTSLVIVATYYFLSCSRNLDFRCLIASIGIFTLATLIKTSAAIYLLSALGTVLLWAYLQSTLLTLRQRINLLILSATSVGVIVGYTLFNRYLNEIYSSVQFLAEARPIETAQQYELVTRRIREVWLKEYFTHSHYILLAVSAIVCLISLPRIVRNDWLWASQLILGAIGGWAFFWLMGVQFADHDYYVLAPYWPALTLLVALAIVQAATWQAAVARWSKILGFIHYPIISAALLALLIQGFSHYHIRMSDPYPPFSDYYAYRWMQGGAIALNNAGVPRTATLLVLGEDAPNLSLVYFDRRGVVWKPDINQIVAEEVLNTMTRGGLDHLLMRQTVFKELFQKYPALLSSFKVLINNKDYAVLERRNAPKHW